MAVLVVQKSHVASAVYVISRVSLPRDAIEIGAVTYATRNISA